MNLKDFNTLEDAKTYPEASSRMISPDMMVAFLAMFGVGRAVEAENSEAAFALRKALQFGSEFNLINGHPASVEPLLNQIAAASDEFKSYTIAYANPVIHPFSSTTLIQFNSAKGIYTEKEVSGHIQGQDLKITINETLPEDCIVTSWVKDGIYPYENFGKVVHLKQGVNIYKLKTDNKKADGDLFVRVPLDNFDFTVEVI